MSESALTPALREFVRNSCEVVHGFSRPNWKAISACIATNHKDESAAAWDEASRAWVERLSDDLGGAYSVTAFGRFLLLSELESSTAERYVQFAQSSADKIKYLLGDAAWQTECGMHVVLMFSEEDDYYEYISCFHSEGTHPGSIGVCLHRDYVHIALNRWLDHTSAHVLAHELAHLFVAHLQLPRWINEAWAMAVERHIFGRPIPLLERDVADDLWEFWTEDRIQEFWAGTSFDVAGKSSTLSYRLSQLLLNSAMRDLPAFREFLKRADYRDGGQDAALQCLGFSIGDLAGEFLGQGHWRPNRKRIAEALRSKAEPATNELIPFVTFICESWTQEGSVRTT
jgi:hypothetical protein